MKVEMKFIFFKMSHLRYYCLNKNLFRLAPFLILL